MNEYINDLRKYLEEKEVEKNEIDEIINDYLEFYEEYLANGLSDEEIIEKLGTPKEIYKSLRETIIKDVNLTFKNKIVSISPFVSVILYILLGYFLKAWHPGWVVFLSIPLSAVFFNNGKLLKRMTESLIFVGIILSILITYFNILEWKYAWLFFILFLLPSVFAYNNQTKNKAILSEVSLITAIITYIILIALNVIVPIALLSFLLPLTVLIYTGNIEVKFGIEKGARNIITIISFVISIALFIILGIIFTNWSYIWQILLIPFIITILVQNNKSGYVLTSIMPFLSTIIFYSLGYFYDAWSISWLAYLLIPLMAIFEEKPIVEIKQNQDE